MKSDKPTQTPEDPRFESWWWDFHSFFRIRKVFKVRLIELKMKLVEIGDKKLRELKMKLEELPEIKAVEVPKEHTHISKEITAVDRAEILFAVPDSRSIETTEIRTSAVDGGVRMNLIHPKGIEHYTCGGLGMFYVLGKNTAKKELYVISSRGLTNFEKVEEKEFPTFQVQFTKNGELRHEAKNIAMPLPLIDDYYSLIKKEN